MTIEELARTLGRLHAWATPIIFSALVRSTKTCDLAAWHREIERVTSLASLCHHEDSGDDPARGLPLDAGSSDVKDDDRREDLSVPGSNFGNVTQRLRRA